MTDLREELPLLTAEGQPNPVDGVTAPSRVCTILKEELHELKWLVLAVACFLTFGSYYIFDFPGSVGTGPGNTIESLFVERGREYTQSMNQLLYSVYSWPNTVLAVFGGLLIDRFLGLRRAMLLFTALILTGSLLFYAGLRSTSFPLMVAARVIFGLGGESLSVSQSAFVARWFKGGRGMALAFGVTISFSRVGSSVNFFFSPLIARHYGVEMAVLTGSVACGVSLVSCFALIVADVYAVRTGYIKPEARDAPAAATVAAEAGSDDVAAAIAGEQTALTEEIPAGPAQRRSVDAQRRPSENPTSPADETGVMKLSDVLHLPVKFWLLTAICVALYTAIFPFIGIARNFFEVKYGYTGSQASQYLSSYQLTAAVASPLIGLIVDAVGRNTYWLTAASVAFMLVHVMLTFTMIPALVVMVSMGCFYSFLVSGLWPSIPWAVAENIVGVSYGLMTAVQNIGLALFPYLVGVVLDRYTPTQGGDSSSSMSSSSSMWPSSFFASSASSASSPSSMSSSTSVLFGHTSQSQLAGSSSSSSSSDNSFDGGSSGGAGPSTLPTMEGYFWTEMLFLGAATVSFIASLALLIVDLRGDGVLSATGARRRELQAMKEEEESVLQGLIPESERGRLDNTA